MKIKFTILISFLSLFALAQPILNSSGLNYNSTGTAYSANPVGIVAGSSGANQTWNYSSTVLTTIGPVVGTEVTTAPFASNFPQANYFVKTNFNGTIYYLIAKSSATKLENLGIVTDTSILVNFSPNPQTQYEFPLSYNQTITDSYALTSDPTVNNSFTITYDAYGTLITPFGTYSNVVRIKRLDGIFPIFSWCTTNPIREILNIRFGSAGVVSAQFTEYPVLGLDILEKDEKIIIYPNPSSDSFIISGSGNANFEFKIFDLVGKIVKIGKTIAFEKIDIENLENGNYIIQIKDEKGSILNRRLLKN